MILDDDITMDELKMNVVRLYVTDKWVDGYVTLMTVGPELELDKYDIVKLHHHLTNLLRQINERTS